jgi:putative DNA primase/helicase
MSKQYDSTVPADLARLKGARMVTAIEVNWNRQIDEAKLKAMTGGEPITARFMRQNFFEFTPEFKLWLVANDYPQVRDTSGAFWERVRVIPFEVHIPDNERDPHLREKLKAEWPGILAWAVRGCLKWQREGLGKPQAVKEAIGGWKGNADHVRKFVKDELVRDSGNQLSSSDLYARYKAWCENHGEKPLTDKILKPRLQGLDLTHKRVNTGSVWVGVKLRLD